MRILKNTIKKLAKKFGFEISKYYPGLSGAELIVSSFRNFEIDLVLDVGANQGQFGSEIRSGGYKGNIVSFEPLSSVYGILKRHCDKDRNWTVHSRCAIGNRIGSIEINIAGNSESSSILPMLESHSSAEPLSVYVGKETVPLITLDSVAPIYMKMHKNVFLKIDTQGFESAVLDGSEKILPDVRGVLLELSLLPLYEGQHLWGELIARLEGHGFTLWSIQPGFTDPQNGRTLQVDGIFYRK
jgi:FkbM family methyltransferase